MSDNQLLTVGEFTRTMDAFSERIDMLTEQVKTTNGRMGTVERTAASEGQKVRNLEREIFRGARKSVGLVTMRDVYLVLGTVVTLGAIVKWFPAFFAAAQVAP